MMMSFWNRVAVAFLMGLALCGSGAAKGQTWNLVDTRLANGLRVVTHEDFSNPQVSVQVWYRVGSKDEPASRQGMAHLVEHLMFRGSSSVEDYQHGALIHAVGGNNNAYTYFDHTAYVNNVPAAQLELALWLEAERMAFLDIRETAFETERSVVEEERRVANLNAPYGTLPERVLPVIFHHHPYRWLPIGKLEYLRATAIEDVRHFWDTYYVPNNATLVIAGAVSHEDALAAAKRYFGWIPKAPEPPRVTIEEPPQNAERTLVLRERLGPVPLVGYVYRGLPADHPDAIPLRMVLWLLAHGEDSRIHRDIVRDRRLCVMLLTQDFCLEQDGVAGFVGALHPLRYYLGKLNPFGRPGDAVFRVFDSHIAEFQQEGPTSEELEKVKSLFRRAAISESLAVADRAWKFGEGAILHGDPAWVNREVDIVAGVTAEDLRRVTATYLVPERRTRVRVLPDKGFDYKPRVTENLLVSPFTDTGWRKAAWERSHAFPAAPPLNVSEPIIPDIASHERFLSNGLKVVVVPDSESPLFVAAMGFKVGPWAEPKVGATYLTLRMLREGTERHTAEEIAHLIEQKALKVQEVAVMDGAMLVVSGLAETHGDCLNLLAELVRSPVFPRKELRMLKREQRVMLRYVHSDPAYRADFELDRQLFEEHRYARPVTGGPGDLRRLGRNDLTEWWEVVARPEDAVLYLGGDVAVKDTLAWAEEAFGDWGVASTEQPVRLSDTPAPEPTHVYLVDVPGAVQSQIRIGQVSLSPDHRDYFAGRVFSEVYGGSFDSRLNMVLRGEQGRTYGAFGGFSFHRHCGYFKSSVSTKTSETSKALASMLDVLESMRVSPPSTKELEQAQSHLIGSAALRLETFVDTVNFLWYLEYMGFAEGHLSRAL
ncbi:MAG: pitrilysin family protein, partial [Candidatus Hydrogenedentes bacterium]|nr:pitrilysin family protein [Candidatus Hydrogenedentota bacterium]